MVYETIHLQKQKITHGVNFLLLLLPIIVFVVTLAFLISKLQHQDMASTNGPVVLGEEGSSVDNTDNININY